MAERKKIERKILNHIGEGDFSRAQEKAQKHGIAIPKIKGMEDKLHEAIGKFMVESFSGSVREGIEFANRHGIELDSDWLNEKIREWLGHKIMNGDFESFQDGMEYMMDKGMDLDPAEVAKFVKDVPRSFEEELKSYEGLFSVRRHGDKKSFKKFVKKVQKNPPKEGKSYVDIDFNSITHRVPVSSLKEICDKFSKKEIPANEVNFISYVPAGEGMGPGGGFMYLTPNGRMIELCIASGHKKTIKRVLEELGRKKQDRTKMPRSGEPMIRPENIAMGVTLVGDYGLSHKKFFEGLKFMEDIIKIAKKRRKA